jgi:TetR/AcrR family transcriptional regulator
MMEQTPIKAPLGDPEKLPAKRKAGRPAGKRRVGRPKEGSGDAARDALVKAGAQLFSYKGYNATKISELAKAAGVTPAMVHYYFGGKEKLAEAVLEEAYEPLMAQIEAIDTLDDWVVAFHSLLLKYRWLPHLMHREVLTHGGHLTKLFQERYAHRFAPKWFSLVAAEKTAGRLRADLNEFRHVMFLIAMLVHPFMLEQIETPFHSGSFTDEELIEFRNDALALFRRGTSAENA